MPSHTIEPQEEIAERFGVRLAGELGGRLNRHWLAEAGGERLVLRRWWQPAASVAYETLLLARLAALGWPVAPVVAGPIEARSALWTL
ncbi:MAG TPA: hypothetical protein VGE07_30015, partial [Herpetosiphonaceae bacterium]